MNIKSLIMSGLATMTIGALTLAPVPASAQWRRHHREQQRNEWRDIAIGAGALGLIGALNHDDTLTFAGTAGALYSVYRYDQDRDSSDRQRRLRAEYFSHPYFYRDGVRYERHKIHRDGDDYYQFVRRR